MDKQSKQIGKMGPEGRPDPILGGGAAEEAGQAETLELASSQMFVWHASSPEGAADFKGPALPDDPTIEYHLMFLECLSRMNCTN